MSAAELVRRTRILVVLLATTACSDPVATDRGRHRVAVTIAGAPSDHLARAQGPFVSVADSVALTVRQSEGSPLILGAALGASQTAVSFPITVVEGRTRFEARVVSVRGIVLFSGEATVLVNSDQFQVSVPLTAQAPVLLAEPDVVTIQVPPRGLGQGSVTVYNRGIGAVALNVRDTSLVSRTQCAGTVDAPRCFRVLPVAGNVVRGQPLTVTIDSVRRFPTPVPLTFSSPEGDVVVVVRTP